MATQATDDTSYWPWVLGGGALLALGGLYAASKAAEAYAPYALALGAPDLLPHYEEWRRARTPDERRAAVLRGAEHLGRGDY